MRNEVGFRAAKEYKTKANKQQFEKKKGEKKQKE